MCTHTCVYIDVYMYIQDDYIHMYVYTCMLIHIEHILNLGAIAVVCIVPLYHTKWYSLLYMCLIGNGREERARCKYTISKLGEMQIHKRYPLVYLHLADFFVCSFPTSILFYFCIASICTFTFFPFYIMHRFHFCPIFLFLCLIASWFGTSASFRVNICISSICTIATFPFLSCFIFSSLQFVYLHLSYSICAFLPLLPYIPILY